MSLIQYVIFRSVIFTIILSSFFTITIVSTGYCEEWVYVGKNDKLSYYYNNTNMSIDRQSKQIKVWIKYEYTDKGREMIMNSRKEHNLDPSRYSKLNYSLNLHIYDYKKLKLKVISGTDYSLSKTILGSFNASDAEWDDIIPKTIVYYILTDIAMKNNLP
jgi:hypothetical protein